MKQAILILILAVALALPSAPAQSQGRPGTPDRLQLLMNPSFTEGMNERGHPKGWLPAMLPARSGNLEWGVEESDGRRLLFIRQDRAGAGVFNHWAQSVLAPPTGSGVVIEADIKTAGVTAPGAIVLLVFRDGSGQVIHAISNLAGSPPLQLVGDTNWRVVRLHGTVPAGCLRLDARVGLVSGSTGAVMIRSVRLYHDRGGPSGGPGGDRQPGDDLNLPGESASVASASPATPLATITAVSPTAPVERDSADAVPTSSPPAQAAQLLANPDFRQADAAGNPAAWFCTILRNFSRDAQSGLAMDAGVPYLYLTQTSAGEGAFNNWAQRVDNPPAGATLRLTVEAATRSANPGAAVKLEFLDQHGTLIGAVSSEGRFDLSGTKPWQAVTLDAPVPAGSARAVVRAGLNPLPGNGTLYLRGATLTVVPGGP